MIGFIADEDEDLDKIDSVFSTREWSLSTTFGMALLRRLLMKPAGHERFWTGYST